MSNQTGEMTQAEINDMEVDFSYGDHPEDENRVAMRIDNTSFKDFVISFKYVRPDFDEESETASLSFEYDVLEVAEGHDPADYENNEALHEVVGKIAMDLFIQNLESMSKSKELEELTSKYKDTLEKAIEESVS